MRLLALVVGATVAIGISNTTGATVQAEPANNRQTKQTTQAETHNSELLALFTDKKERKVSLNEWVIKEDDETEKKQPVVHVVEKGDTLTGVAEQYETEWIRLWQKNTELEHPDILAVDEELTVPFEDEELTERDLPEPPAQEEAAVTSHAATTNKPSSSVRQGSTSRPAATTYAPRGSSSGNLYTPGYCTWYAKNKRPDLPNNLGNADTWVSRARAQGIPTGSTPRAGAIGQRGMHVVYVERVNRDGTVTISEMNHKGLYVITTRTLPASYFMYIY
jgi:surface antigen